MTKTVITIIIAVLAVVGISYGSFQYFEKNSGKSEITSLSIEPSEYQNGRYVYKYGAKAVVRGNNLKNVEIRIMPTGTGMGMEYPDGKLLGQATQINGNTWSLDMPENLLTTSFWAEVEDPNGKRIKSLDLGHVSYDESGLLSGIVVSSPQPNQFISSPLEIFGTMYGNGWICFEGQCGSIKLLDNIGQVLASDYLRSATDEWGRLPVDFKATLSFIYPQIANPTPQSNGGILIFTNEDPSGLPGMRREYQIPISFANTAVGANKTTIKEFKMSFQYPASWGRFNYKIDQPFSGDIGNIIQGRFGENNRITFGGATPGSTRGREGDFTTDFFGFTSLHSYPFTSPSCDSFQASPMWKLYSCKETKINKDSVPGFTALDYFLTFNWSLDSENEFYPTLYRVIEFNLPVNEYKIGGIRITMALDGFRIPISALDPNIIIPERSIENREYILNLYDSAVKNIQSRTVSLNLSSLNDEFTDLINSIKF